MSSIYRVGQFLAPQRTADQKSQDDVVSLPFQLRAVGHLQQFFRLLAGQPVPQPNSLLAQVWDASQVLRLFR